MLEIVGAISTLLEYITMFYKYRIGVRPRPQDQWTLAVILVTIFIVGGYFFLLLGEDTRRQIIDVLITLFAVFPSAGLPFMYLA